jgi:carboxylesterase type B
MYSALRALEPAGPLPYLPVISESMPVHPADAAHAGFGLDLDYLTGTCVDEVTFASGLQTAMQVAQIRQHAERILTIGSVDRKRLLSIYRAQRSELSVEQAEMAMLGDIWVRLPTLRVAQGHALRGVGKTYCYCFASTVPESGAAHGSDLIMFGNKMAAGSQASNEAAVEVGALMRRAWCNFARNGDPSVIGSQWPQYDNKRQPTMRIDSQPTIIERPFAQQSRLLGRVMANNWQTMGI